MTLYHNFVTGLPSMTFIVTADKQECAAVEGPPAMGRPCSICTIGISFSVRVKAHVPKPIRKKK